MRNVLVPIKKLSLCLIALCVFASLWGNDFRTFTSIEGLKIVAKVILVDGDQVTIERKDMKRFTIPVERLSEPDQSYLQSLQNTATEVVNEESSDLDVLRDKLAKQYPEEEGLSSADVRKAFGEAREALKEEDFEEAIGLYASIPQDSDAYADARRRAGFNVLGRELGKWDEALVFLLDAYEASPKDKKVLEDLGRTYVRLEMYDDARIILKKAGTKNAREELRDLERR